MMPWQHSHEYCPSLALPSLLRAGGTRNGRIGMIQSISCTLIRTLPLVNAGLVNYILIRAHNNIIVTNYAL